MRQSREGVTRIVEQAPADASADAPRGVIAGFVKSARTIRWTSLLVWFMRTMAVVWIAKGLFNWSIVMGANPLVGDFLMLPRLMKGGIIVFAVADLLAAIGLWLAAPWGGVLWLLCAASEAVSPVLAPRATMVGPAGIALDVVLIGVYFALSWIAGRERH